MTREQARQELINLGIAEPTDDAVTTYLNRLNAETKVYKDREAKLREDASRVDELQKQLDDLNSQNLSDVEKANKALEDANTKYASLEKKLMEMELRKGLAEQGITGEHADKLAESILNGKFDASVLGEIISLKEKDAVSNFEKQSLKDTLSPDANGGSKGDENKETSAETIARSIGKQSAETQKASADILSNYI